MKTIRFLAVLILVPFIMQAQHDKLYFKKYNYDESYYYGTILKAINQYESKNKKHEFRRIKVDVTGRKFPNDPKLYKQQWHNPPISQGNTGTCWDFSTTSLMESEVYRLTGQKVKLSEMYVAYWEYVEKAKGFVESRGNSVFDEGSEANAVTRIYKKYGVVPESVYNGLLPGQKFYNHEPMVKEMKKFLSNVKENDMWNEDFVISTIKSILNKYMGEPPTEFEYKGKKITPKQYLKDVLKLNPDDYVDILSYEEHPFYQQCSYDVPDNWWHSKDYYNVPLNDFFNALKNAIKNGYTVSIGGDVSEPGLLVDKGDPQVAIVPDFDIPSKYINDDAREFRFANKTTTDDHGMHLVGYYVDKKTGKTWFLIKDSSSGSRNNAKNDPKFGYYFFSQDYVRLKMMDFMVHKDAVKDLLKKFKK